MGGVIRVLSQHFAWQLKQIMGGQDDAVLVIDSKKQSQKKVD